MTNVALRAIQAVADLAGGPRMLDGAGRSFEPNRLDVTWALDDTDRLVLFSVMVSGLAVRKDGTVGTGSIHTRHLWYEVTPHPADGYRPPLADAPGWVRQFIQAHQPATVTAV